MTLGKHNQLVMVVVISTKWDFYIVCNCSKFFLTKIIIIIVVIALIKTERECIRKIGRKIATLPEPTGLSQEQQKEQPSGLEGSLNSLTEAVRKVIPECTH